MSNKIRLMSLLSLAVMSLGLTACNTVDGAGKDLEKAGESVQQSAH